ncbi:MAG: methyltransferase domain-containing protein [Deltaproteobacteria bacterium]|nr:methyltransferase domain-containing protein [Deltaproteobacteria bacterium]
MPHKFDPADVERLLSEERHRDIAPERLLREAGLKPGDAFADIGCGPGFFAIPAAHIVGEKGVVYAVDTEEKMLGRLRERRPPANVVPLKSMESSVPVKDSAVDIAFLGYMLHEAEDKPLFLKEVKRIIRDGGAVIIIDWKKKKEEEGPPLEERLTEDEVIGLLKGAGFEKVKALSLNESHYEISARRG